MGALTTAHRLDSDGCSFSWAHLRCMPKEDCMLQWKPRFFTLGPCVTRTEKAECNETTTSVDDSTDPGNLKASSVPPTVEEDAGNAVKPAAIESQPAEVAVEEPLAAESEEEVEPVAAENEEEEAVAEQAV